MTEPDPDFIEFFSADYKSKSEWQKLLDAVEIPGMDNPSWDRRAAYLLWVMGGHYDAETPWHWRDVMRQVVMPGEPAPPPRPLSEVLTIHREDTTQFPYAPYVQMVGRGHRSSVGKAALIMDMARQDWGVNPIEDADCQPTPGGVKFAFDAVKVSGEK